MRLGCFTAPPRQSGVSWGCRVQAGLKMWRRGVREGAEKCTPNPSSACVYFRFRFVCFFLWCGRPGRLRGSLRGGRCGTWRCWSWGEGCAAGLHRSDRPAVRPKRARTPRWLRGWCGRDGSGVWRSKRGGLGRWTRRRGGSPAATKIGRAGIAPGRRVTGRRLGRGGAVEGGGAGTVRPGPVGWPPRGGVGRGPGSRGGIAADHRRSAAVQRMPVVVVAAPGQAGDTVSAAVDVIHVLSGRIVIGDAAADIEGRAVILISICNHPRGA